MDVSYSGYSEEFEVTDEVTVTVGLDDLLNEVDSEKLREHLEGIGELYGDTDELIRILIDGDQERAMLDEIDNGAIVEIVGAADLLAEMDEDVVVDYCRNNGLINDEDHIDAVISAKQLPELADAVQGLGLVDDLLRNIDSEFIQKHLENKRGGFTLENVSVEDLIGALEAKDVPVGGFTITAGVAQAFRTLAEFCRVIENGSREGLEGKRFVLPTE